MTWDTSEKGSSASDSSWWGVTKTTVSNATDEKGLL